MIGEDIQIFIDETEYTTKISNITENGGENIYSTIKCFNNSYKKTLIGVEPFTLEITFKCDDDTLHTLYENNEPITIYWKEKNDNIIVTYTNLTPISIKYDPSVDNILTAVITYHASPYDENGELNRQVI